MKHKSEYFTLFSNCIPISGAKNAAIYDVQYHELVMVPVELVSVLEKIKTLTQAEYKDNFDEETLLVLSKYIEFLEKNEVGFWSTNPEWFPPISDEWDFPSITTNAIITIEDECFFAKKAIEHLDDLNCKALELRFTGKEGFKKVKEILDFTKESGIQYIQCIVNLFDKNDTYDWLSIIKNNPRLHNVDIYNSTISKVDTIDENRTISYHTNDFTNLCCGVVDKKYFSVNIPNYTESLRHNSCLNRKISIDAQGNIKNCPSMPQSFGNIKDTTLAEALEKSDFKKYWNINKDKIHVCKDCEFRYICTDCRAYVEDPEDILSKPLKCGYNPYTGEWSEWSTNPLKQKAIEHYGMQDLIAETKQEV